MHVMLSDGSVVDIEGDELRYWCSSFGQLGLILSVEVQLHSERDGGFRMSQGSVVFPLSRNATNAEIAVFLQQVISTIYGFLRSNASQLHFFYNW